MALLNRIRMPGFGDVLEMLVLACIFYYIFLFFRGTRGAQVLSGLAILLVILIGLTQGLRLDALNWLLRRFSVYLVVALLIIFQPEIRRALAELGRQPRSGASSNARVLIDHLVQAVSVLAEQRIGALIAIEREIGTRAIRETGTRINSDVTPELLASVFFPHTPLHDGGVIISGNRIVAAGCLFPLSQKTELRKGLGTRHRAAIGLTEETDAVVVVVSEESGTISVAYRGRLSRGLDADRLRRFLSAVLVKSREAKSPWKRAKEHLDLTPKGLAKTEILTEEDTGNGG
ncbi:MAG: diadenylate cyclase CdaA [Kiritimatiellae bacterium]|nr:diadenylate cyclase CdaA [Kiritimatiellia bacterium]